MRAVLDKNTFNSDAWRIIYAEAATRLEQHLLELMCCRDVERATFLRGKIESLRELIEQDTERFSKFSVNPFPH